MERNAGEQGGLAEQMESGQLQQNKQQEDTMWWKHSEARGP